MNKFDTTIDKEITRLFCKGQVGGKQFRYQFLNGRYNMSVTLAIEKRREEIAKNYLWEEKDRHRLLLLRAYFLTAINIDRSSRVKMDRNARGVEGCGTINALFPERLW